MYKLLNLLAAVIKTPSKVKYYSTNNNFFKFNLSSLILRKKIIFTLLGGKK